MPPPDDHQVCTWAVLLWVFQFFRFVWASWRREGYWIPPKTSNSGRLHNLRPVMFLRLLPFVSQWNNVFDWLLVLPWLTPAMNFFEFPFLFFSSFFPFFLLLFYWLKPKCGQDSGAGAHDWTCTCSLTVIATLRYAAMLPFCVRVLANFTEF